MATQSTTATASAQTPRGERVIARAIELMAQGSHGWSYALAKARAEIRQ